MMMIAFGCFKMWPICKCYTFHRHLCGNWFNI